MRFNADAFMFHLAWNHRGPFPRRTREQRREDYRRACQVTVFEVERCEAQIRAGNDVEPDRTWRPTA